MDFFAASLSAGTQIQRMNSMVDFEGNENDTIITIDVMHANSVASPKCFPVTHFKFCKRTLLENLKNL